MLAKAGGGDQPLRRQAGDLAARSGARGRPGELANQEPTLAERRLDAAELDPPARELERRRRAQRDRHLPLALERGDFARPEAVGVAAAKPRLQLGIRQASGKAAFVAC